jgi:hypothetical protein
MSPDTWGLLVSIGTLIVIGASAVAALVQLRHLRASNQLEALLSLEREFHGEELQESFRYVQSSLHSRLQERSYRLELERIGFIDTRAHPEMNVMNWFNEMGALLKNALVEEPTFMELFGRLAVQYWEILAPAVAIIRRRRGDAQFHNFEYLAIRARKWLSDHPRGSFPKDMPRIPLVDDWLEADSS